MNQFQFFCETLFNDRIAFTITPANSRPACFQEERKVVVRPVVIVGEDQAKMIPVSVAASGQLHRIGQGFGTIGEVPGHLLGRFQPLSGLNDFFRGKSAQGAIAIDGPHQAVQWVILRVRKIDRIGSNGRYS